MGAHPDATPERVLALIAAVGSGHAIEVDFSVTDRDAYARLVDTLDAMAWLDPKHVRLIKRNASSTPWEQVVVGGVRISSPYGYTPVSDRLGLTREQPILKLAGRAAPDASPFVAPRVVPIGGGDAA